MAVNVRLQGMELNTMERSLVEPLFLDIWAVDKFFEYNKHKGTIVPQLKPGTGIEIETCQHY